MEEIKWAFVESVEDYLAFCAERNEKPNKPFSGEFRLRIAPDLHRDLTILARQTCFSQCADSGLPFTSCQRSIKASQLNRNSNPLINNKWSG